MKKILIILLILLLTACSNNENNNKINYVQAKEKIINENAILIDVREEDEYNENHINGAINLPLNTIDENTSKELIENKESVIIVYCKSGRRSNEALIMLKELGYKNVYDFGAMDNWK